MKFTHSISEAASCIKENDIIVIDNNEKNLEKINGKEGIIVIQGNASSPKTLSKAGFDSQTLLA